MGEVRKVDEVNERASEAELPSISTGQPDLKPITSRAYPYRTMPVGSTDVMNTHRCAPMRRRCLSMISFVRQSSHWLVLGLK
jgi:hypothetical protein